MRGAQQLADGAAGHDAARAIAHPGNVVLFADDDFLDDDRPPPDAHDFLAGGSQFELRADQFSLVEAALDVDRVADFLGKLGHGEFIHCDAGHRRSNPDLAAQVVEAGLVPGVEGGMGGQHAADAHGLEIVVQIDVVLDFRIEAGNHRRQAFPGMDVTQALEQGARAHAGVGNQIGDIGMIRPLPVQAAFQRIVGEPDQAQAGKAAAQAGDHGGAGLRVFAPVQTADGDGGPVFHDRGFAACTDRMPRTDNSLISNSTSRVAVRRSTAPWAWIASTSRSLSSPSLMACNNTMAVGVTR